MYSLFKKLAYCLIAFLPISTQSWGNYDEIESFNTEAFSLGLPCDDDLPSITFQDRSDFTLENAFLLHLYSWLSHHDDVKVIRSHLKRLKFHDITLTAPDSTGIKAIVARHGKRAFISFRGSKGALDTATDAMILQAPALMDEFPGRVHLGFYGHYRNLERKLSKKMKKWQAEGVKFYITGHSLGGSAAVLFALKRASLGANIGALYTFAHPRIGNEAFSHYVKKTLPNYYRVELEGDIVPQVPPTRGASAAFSKIVPSNFPKLRKTLADFAGWLKYAHHGGVVYSLSKDGFLHRTDDDDSVRELDFWKGYEERVAGEDLKGVIKKLASSNDNHIPTLYICTLARAVP